MLKKVSIVTVCFNSGSTIRDTIKSVFSQDYSNIEYIIIDGVSEDNTMDIVREFKDDIDVVISDPDKGIYDAMNKGISIASGELLGFLNADDVYANKNVIDKVVSEFADPIIDACYGDLVYVCASNIDKIVRYWKSSTYVEGLFAKGWNPPHPTFFVRASVYRKYGGFDLKYTMGNDVELMMRLLERYKIKSMYLPEVLVKMRMGGVSNKSIKNIIKQNKEIIRAARDNNITIPSLSFILYKIKSRLSQFIMRA